MAAYDIIAAVPQRLTPAKDPGRNLPNALLAVRMGLKWRRMAPEGRP